jgi:hypothetical protein
MHGEEGMLFIYGVADSRITANGLDRSFFSVSYISPFDDPRAQTLINEDNVMNCWVGFGDGPVAGSCNGMANYSQYPGTGCAPGFINSGGMCTCSPAFISACNRFSGYNPESCGCDGSCDPSQGGCSPIVVDILGNGFAMTSGANGVMFDLQANGTPRQYSWLPIPTMPGWRSTATATI